MSSSAATKLIPAWSEREGIEKTEVASHSRFSPKAIGLASATAPEEVLDLALSKGLHHICQKDNPFCDSDVETSGLMIIEPHRFMDLPLSGVLDPQNCSMEKEQELTHFRSNFSKIAEKHSMLESLREYLARISKSNSLHSEIILVADELFTNAVFNSARAGKPLLRGDTSVTMPDGFQGEIRAGVTGGRFALVCTDPFGNLELPKLVQRMRDCYTKGVQTMMNLGEGGAGIGSYLVYSAATSYFACVERGRRTVIVWSVPLNLSLRKRVMLPKNAHFIGF